MDTIKKLLFISVILFAATAGSVNADNQIKAFAGTPEVQGYSGDGGPATSAEFNDPSAIAIDAAGNVYIADAANHRIRKVDTLGTITTFAGNGTPGFSGDGGPATSAELYYPYGVAVDTSGNVYVADTWNNRIRKVDTSGVITTFAGNGTSGFEELGGTGNSGDGGPATAASLYGPEGVAVDALGNVYIAARFVRKVDTSGIITTIAGKFIEWPTGNLGDGGPATSAELSAMAVAVDGSGNVYISDQLYERIRKVNASGIITTVAGANIIPESLSQDPSVGYSGDGGPAVNAMFSGTGGIAVDASGNLYISDAGNRVVRRVNPSGIISTFAGNGTMGSSGDGGGALAAELILPTHVAVGPSGDVFVADWSEIREVVVVGTGTVSGRVTGPDGTTGVAAYIKVSLNSVFINSTASDSSGNYSMQVPSGTYDITLNYFDVTQKKSFQELSNQTTTVDFPLIFGFISGKITHDDGVTAFPDVGITPYKNGTQMNGALSNSSGNYFLVLDTGTYDLTVQILGYVTQTKSTQCVSGLTATVNFAMHNPTSFVVTSNANNGTGTLREALGHIDDSDTITFNLSAGNETISITSDLEIRYGSTIDGSNSAGSGVGVTIQVSTSSVSPCIFHIYASDENVVLNNITMRGGSSQGVIYGESCLSLALNNCTIEDGISYSGGGICGNDIVMTNCTVRNNTATSYGGGIAYVGKLSMSGCTVSSNTASSKGGAIYANAAANIFTIDKCTISNNTSNYGGGGAIYTQVSDTLPDSIITNSTINNNTSSGTGNYGGALCLFGGHYEITNCTIIGNSASTGGAIYDLATLYLTNTTIAGNSASSQGGGLYAFGPLYIKNTLLANNNSKDFWFATGSVIDNGYNIVGSTYAYTFNGTGDITGYQPNLRLSGALAANDTVNGTQTLAILSNSVAVNAGDGAANGTVAIPFTDQRGYARAGAPDIGAYEYVVLSSPLAPGSYTGTTLSSGSICWQWQASTGATHYQVMSSTGGQMSTGLTPNTTVWVEGGLSPNTTYYRYVEAFMGGYYSSSTIAGVLTNVVAPNNIVWGAAASTSAAVSWTDNTGNPANTTYIVQLSTMPDFSATIYSSSTVKAAGGAMIQPLTPNTFYYGQVTAVSYTGVSSASALSPVWTLTSAAVPQALAFNSVFISSAALSWTANNNPLINTRYEVSLSTDNFTANFSTPIALSYGFTALNTTAYGLAAATTYYARVRAYDILGNPSGFSDIISTMTLPPVPVTLSVLTVSSSTAVLSWLPNGNPLSTVYEVYYSSDNFCTLFSTPIVFSERLTALTTTVYSLAPNTIYWFKVRSFQYTGIPETFSNTVSAITQLFAPNNISWGAIASTSAAVSWTDDTINLPYTAYIVQLSTAPDFSGTVYSSSTVKAEGGATVQPLIPNTTFYGRVTASSNGVNLPTALNPTWKFTPAAIPLAPVFTSVFVSSAAISWNANNNPPNTRYEVSLSTDNFTANFSTPAVLASSLTAANTTVYRLMPNTTYYARVRAFASNDAATPTTFSSIASMVTAPSAPNNISWGTILSTSIAVSWTDSTNNPVNTTYIAQLSTAANFSGTIYSSSTLKAASGALVQPLTPNTTYYGRVSALSFGGVNSSSVLSPAWKLTSAAIPSAPVFDGVFVTSVTISWSANSNPSNTRYEVSLSTDNFTANFSTPAALAAGLTALTTTVYNLTINTTYYARIRAYDASGNPSAFSAKIIAVTGSYSSFVVTSSADSGAGTLREAISVVCDSGTITFSLSAGNETITLASELAFNKSLTIDGSNSSGSGAEVTIKVTNPGVSAWRVFNLYLYPSKNVSLNNLVMIGGNISSSPYLGGANLGGVIYCAGNPGTGQSLALTNCTITDGNAFTGGGIHFTTYRATMVLTSCTIKNNQCINGGGGIYVIGSGLSMYGCNVSSNNANAGVGGGIADQYGNPSFTYPLIIDKCTISSNTASYGGGIFVENPSTTAKITNSAINNNISATLGGGIQFALTSSGGIYQIANCTIFGNSTVDGGGVNCAASNQFYLTNVTIAGNSASNQGGGFYMSNAGAQLFIKNTLIANNGSNDFWMASGIVNDNGYNIVVSTHGYTFNGTHDITGYQPNLNISGVLAPNNTLNGTQTLSVSAPSIVIDAGSAVANGGVAVPETDQRGFARVGVPDIGAYEVTDPPPVPVGFIGAVLSTGSIRWQWQNSAGVNGYRVRSSTGGALSANLTATTTEWYEGGLTANTTYFRYVEACVSVLTSASSSAAAMTYAAVPGPLDFNGVFSSSATLSWNAGGNPATTRYELSISTDGFALNYSTPVTLGSAFTSTNTTLYGLVPNTTYFARVRAFASTDASTPTSFSGIVSTMTLPAKVNLAVGNIAMSSVTISWDTNNNPPDTRYELYSSSDNFCLYFSTTVLFATALTAVTTAVDGLAADTTYWFKVCPFQSSGRPGAMSNTASAVTLADAPNGISWGAVVSTAIAVSWAGDTSVNRPGTIYAAQLSTYKNFTGGVYSSATVRSMNGALVAGLTPNTTYYARVVALNGAGIPDYAVLVQGALTLAAVPVSLAASKAGLSSARFSWNGAGNPGYTRYEVSVSTDNFSICFSTPVQVSAGLKTASTIVTGLTRETTYWLRVRAFNEDLSPSGFASLKYLFTTPPFVCIDLAGSGILSYACDDNCDPADGYEDYLAAGSTMAYRIDGTGTGKTNFLVSTAGDPAPEYYWDPDHARKYRLIVEDMSGDGVADYLFDSNGDGLADSYYNPITRAVVRANTLTTVPGVPGTFFDFNGGTDGYEVYVDSSGRASSIVAVVAKGDGKKEHLIDTNAGASQATNAPGRAALSGRVPTIYVDPYSKIVTPIKQFDYDGDGTTDWGIDLDGSGKYVKYYNPKSGLLLDIFSVTEEKGYVPSPNPFNPLRGNAVFVYDMAEDGQVIIDIYAISGQKTTVLVNGERVKGRHQFQWNGGNGEYDAADGTVAGSNNKLAKGVYIVRYKLGSKQFMKKLAIIK